MGAATRTATTTGSTRKTQGNQVIRWIELACCFTQAEWYGKPFRLLPWQKRLIRELFEVEDGRRKHRWAYISVPKKNGKTELMAALALWFLIASGEPAPLVACAAGSDDQADLIFGAAKTMCEESPFLRALTDTFDGEIQVKEDAGAKLIRVAASARKFGSNLDGKNVFVVICDELHVWEGDRGEIVWGTLTRGTVARREPMVIQITTAGFDRESICYRQYEYAKRVLADADMDPAYYAYICEAPEGADYRDPKVWEQTNPSFGTIMHAGFYQDQLSKQPENEFRRFYCNQWTRSAESWLPRGAWDACRSDLDIPDGAPIWGGVDVALYHDSTAVVWTALVDGRWVVRSKVWVPPRDGKIDVGEVMAFLRALGRRFDWQICAYDPRFFDIPASTLQDEGIPMLEVPQSAPRMVPACGLAWELIVGRQLAHDGDPTLENHVLSAVQRVADGGWRLAKGKGHNDACIAMVMALWEAAHPEPAADPAISFF
jgi:phage terminase large subunit-like protein